MRKYKTTVIMESCLQANGTRKRFEPGDVIDEKYITPESITQYVKGGLLIEVKEETHGTSGRNPKTTDNTI